MTRRPASLNPNSKTYQRLARRIASNKLAGALRMLRRFASAAELEAASLAVYVIADVARNRQKESDECDPRITRQLPGEKAERRIESESLQKGVAELLEVGTSSDIRLAAFQVHGILARIGAGRRGK